MTRRAVHVVLSSPVSRAPAVVYRLRQGTRTPPPADRGAAAG